MFEPTVILGSRGHNWRRYTNVVSKLPHATLLNITFTKFTIKTPTIGAISKQRYPN